ncbi:GA module-containing protein [Mycoplasmopsis verecunda]|uniref:Chromosome segregation ATPase n=1 Tax=Mycoplasmopsis verecunda TaxID=171291 RepID=A0A1T4L5L2_9BACT|nr:GA module-containing protein [Mycoplasmopsis verecunda]WPB54822.1 GA module-containing protein [Mycoplasmopsis verecunda]SJZ49810.1 Chromosome segregation ATPase [Mycoplasmopsis verecunda]
MSKKNHKLLLLGSIPLTLASLPIVAMSTEDDDRKFKHSDEDYAYLSDYQLDYFNNEFKKIEKTDDNEEEYNEKVKELKEKAKYLSLSMGFIDEKEDDYDASIIFLEKNSVLDDIYDATYEKAKKLTVDEDVDTLYDENIDRFIKEQKEKFKDFKETEKASNFVISFSDSNNININLPDIIDKSKNISEYQKTKTFLLEVKDKVKDDIESIDNEYKQTEYIQYSNFYEISHNNINYIYADNELQNKYKNEVKNLETEYQQLKGQLIVQLKNDVNNFLQTNIYSKSEKIEFNDNWNTLVSTLLLKFNEKIDEFRKHIQTTKDSFNALNGEQIIEEYKKLFSSLSYTKNRAVEWFNDLLKKKESIDEIKAWYKIYQENNEKIKELFKYFREILNFVQEKHPNKRIIINHSEDDFQFSYDPQFSDVMYWEYQKILDRSLFANSFTSWMKESIFYNPENPGQGKYDYHWEESAYYFALTEKPKNRYEFRHNWQLPDDYLHSDYLEMFKKVAETIPKIKERTQKAIQQLKTLDNLTPKQKEYWMNKIKDENVYSETELKSIFDLERDYTSYYGYPFPNISAAKQDKRMKEFTELKNKILNDRNLKFADKKNLNSVKDSLNNIPVDPNYFDYFFNKKIDDNARMAINNGKYNLKSVSEKLDWLQDLTPKQKETIKNTINNNDSKALNSLEDLNKIYEIAKKINEINKSYKAEKNEVTSDKFTNSKEYLLADNKNEFDTVTEALNKVIESLGTVDSIPTLTDIENEVKKATEKQGEFKNQKEKLNGEDNFDKAISDINNLGHIDNENVKKHFKEEIDKAVKDKKTLQEIKDIVKKATDVDEETKKLQEKLTEVENWTNNNNYNLTSDETINQLDKNVNDANAILNDEKLLKDPAKTKEQIENIKTIINQTQDKSHKEVDEVIKKQKDAIEKLNELSNINETQKQTIISKINDPANKATIEKISSDANLLDQAMSKLKENISKANETKNTKKHLLSDSEIKKNFDDILLDDNVNTGDLSSIDPNEINSKGTKIKEATDKLNGDTNLQNSKDSVDEKLSDLNSQLEDKIKKLLDNSSNIHELKNITDKTDELKEIIKKLIKLKENSQNIKSTPNYTEASNKKQYDDKLIEVSNEISTNKNIEIPDYNSLESLITELNKLKDSLIEKQNQLNGKQLLDEAAKKARDVINELNNLSNENKTQIINEINNKKTIQDINDLKDSSISLNKKTQDLLDEISSLETISTKDDYLKYVNQDNKSNLTNILNKQKDILENKKLSPNKTISDIENYKTELSNVKTIIEREIYDFKKYIQDSKDEINKLSNLSPTQKKLIVAEIEKSNDKAFINSLKENSKKLNETIEQALQTKNNLETKKTESNYLEADLENKNALDTAFKELDKALEITKNSVDVKSPVNIDSLLNALKSKIDSAKLSNNNLNGDANLLSAKNNAAEIIKNASNLSDEYKDDLNSELEKINLNNPSVSKYNELSKKVSDLNNKVPELIKSLNDLNSLKESNDYKASSEDTKSKTTEALNSKTSLLNDDNKLINDKLLEDINKAITNINNAKQLISEDKSNFETSKEGLLGNLLNLSSKQKQLLQEKINNSTNKTELDSIVSNAKELDKAMEKLGKVTEEAAKQAKTINYSLSTEENKKEFDNVASEKELEKLQKEQIDSIEPSVINDKNNKIEKATNNLDGEFVFNKNKQDAINTIKTKENLIQSQKDKLIEIINDVKSNEDLDQIKDKSDKLDQLIGALKTTISDANTTKSTPSYTEASDKTDFDNKLKDAELLKNSVTTNTDFIPNTKLDNLIKELTDTKNNLSNAKQSLDGQSRLNKEIENSKNAINGLEYLTKNYIDAIKADLDSKLTINDAQTTKNKAIDLNQSANLMLQAKTKAISLQSNPDYKYATNEQKTALQTAIDNVNNILEQDKLKNNNVKESVDSLTDALNQAMKSINDRITTIKDAIQKADKTIADFENLTAEQKTALKSEVESKITTDDIAQVISKATDLDSQTKELKTALKEADKIDRESDKYKLSSGTKAQDFDSALNDAKTALQSGLANKTKEEIKKLTDKLNDARGSLNGDEVLKELKANSKAEIDKLNNLTKDQIKQINNAIDTTDITPSTISSLVENAKKLDEAIKKADQIKQTVAESKQTPNYLDSDTEKQTAINNSEKTTNEKFNDAKKSFDSVTPEVLNNLTVELNKASEKLELDNSLLNGNELIKNAKADAITSIKNKEHLSTELQGNLISQVNEKSRLSEILTVKNDANNLDDLTKKLIDAKNNLQKVKNDTKKYPAASENTISKVDEALQLTNELLTENKLKNNKTADEIKTATKSLENALQSINDDKDSLETAKTQKINSIKDLLNLSEKQNTTIKSKIADTLTTIDLNNIVDKANRLNDEMGNLISVVDEATKVKLTNKYDLSEETLKKAFDNVANKDKLLELDKEKQDSIEPDIIKNKAKEVSDATKALNGDDKFTEAKELAKEKISNLQISQDQKTKIKDLIDNTETKSDLDSISKNSSDLNQALTDLQTAIENAKKQKQTPNYTEASNIPLFDSKLSDAITGLQTAKTAVITDVNSIKALITPINTLKDNLTNETNKLDGQERLNLAISSAKTVIDEEVKSLHPNNVKNLVKDLESQKTIESVNKAEQSILDLNQSAQKLIEKWNDAKSLTQDPKYNFATEDQKTALAQSIQKANNMLEESKLKSDISKDEVDRVTNELQTAIDEINKIASKVKDVIKQNNDNVEKMSSLTPSQKENLKKEISSKTNESDIDKVISKANDLNEKTKALIDAVKNADSIKENDNYKLSDKEKSSELDNAQKSAKDILENGLETKSPEEIKKLTDDLDKATKNLNGNDNLDKYHNDAILKLDDLKDIPDDVKTKIKEAVNNSNKPDVINSLVDKSTKLNQSIKEGNELNDKVQKDKETANYLDSDQDKQTTLTSVQDSQDNKLTNAKKTPENITVDYLDKITTDLTKENDKLKTALEELNGDEKIKQAKQNVNDLITNKEYLSDPLKQTLKTQINDNSRLKEIADTVSKIDKLDDLANKLQEAKSNIETAKNDSKYKAASNETKKAVEKALEDAKKLLNDSNKLISDTNNQEIEKITNDLKEALKLVDNDKKELEASKLEKSNYVENELPNLSKLQKDAIKAQITGALTPSELNDKVNNANKLNSEMGELAKAIKEVSDVKSTNKYLLSDGNPKEQFDSVASETELAKLAKENQDSINPEEIKTKATTIKDATTNLNGDSNFETLKTNVKDEVEKTKLSDTQKGDFKKLIYEATTDQEVDKLKSQSKALDQAINDLQTAINEATSEKTKPNYTEASAGVDKVKDLFDKQLLNSSNDLSNAKNASLSNDEVIDKLIKDLVKSKDTLNNAKNNLDGQSKLDKAKEDAKADIEALNNLSDNSKSQIKGDIDSKNTILDVNKAKEDADNLNTSANDLITELNKAKDLLKDNDKYALATKDQQVALTGAIESAQNMLETNKLKQNVSKSSADTTKNDLIGAMNAINGLAKEIKSEIQKAKETIDSLEHLTKNQKDSLKSAVGTKTTSEDIKSLLDDAQKLNVSTKNLKDAIEKAKEVDKEANNYKLADPEKQVAFDNSYDKANKAIIDDLLGDKTQKDIDDLTNLLNNSRSALNGDNNLEAKKEAEKRKIDNLDKLSTEQKTSIKNAFNNVTTPSDAENITKAATDLNKLISKAESLDTSINEAKLTPNYTEATNKSDLDTSKSNLINSISKTKENNDLDNVSKLNQLASELNSKIQDADNKLKALDGNEQVSKAKLNAKDFIDNLDKLSTKAKESIKNKLDDSNNVTTISDVEKIKTDAQDLNNKAKSLKDSIDTLTQLNKTNKIDTLDKETKDSISTVLQESNDLFTDEKLKDNISDKSISQQKEKVDKIIEKINNQAKDLDQYKESKIPTFDDLNNLSKAQKDALKTELQNATTKQSVDDVIVKSNELNTEMGDLESALNALKNKINSTDEKLSSDTPKTVFKNLTKDTEISNNTKENISTTNKDEIKAKKQTLIDAVNNLDGNSNLQAAKEEISKLNNLFSDLKDSFIDLLDKSLNKKALDSIVSDAKTIDNEISSIDTNLLEVNKLIKRFEPEKTEQNINAIKSLISEIDSNKDVLDKLKESITDIKNSKSTNPQIYTNLKSGIEKAIEKSKAIIAKVNNKVNEEIADTQLSDIKDKDIKQYALDKSKELENSEINLYKALDNARAIQVAPYLDKYKEVLLNAPEKLQKSPSWIKYSLNNSEELKQASTPENDKLILQKLQHQVAKANLAYAYDDVIGITNPELAEKLIPELQKAVDLLYFNTVTSIDKYNEQAEKLTWFKLANELDKLVSKTNQEISKPWSKQLTNLVNDANSAINNNQSTNQTLQDLINRLNKINIKEPLISAIEEANEFILELSKSIEKDNNDLLVSKKELVENAVNSALNLVNKDELEPKENYVNEALKLKKLLNKVQEEILGPRKALQKVLESAKKINPKSLALQNAINEAKTLTDNSELSDIQKVLKHLNHKITTNDLDLTIDATPKIKDGIYANITPNIIENSKQISANEKVTAKELEKATNKQKVNNKQIDAINGVYDFSSLNKAQKDKFVDNVIKAKDIDSITDFVNEAAKLNTSMKNLANTYNNLDSKLKQSPIVHSDYLNSTKNEQIKVDKLLKDANDLLTENGILYKDNSSTAVDDLIKEINNTLSNLSGKDKDMQKLNDLIDKFNNIKSSVDANKLFNSPKALQDIYNNLSTDINQLINLRDNLVEFNKNGGINKLETLINNLDTNKQEIDKFSSKIFKDNGGNSITQAQSFINENANSLSKNYQAKLLNEFNKQITYKDANNILNQVQNQNNDVSDKLNIIESLISEMLKNINSDLTSVVNQKLYEIKDLANEQKVTDLFNLNNQISQLEDIKNKLYKVINSDAKTHKFNNLMTNLLVDIAEISNIKLNSYPEFEKQFNNKLASYSHNATTLDKVVNAIKSDNHKALEQLLFDNEFDNNNIFIAYIMKTPHDIDNFKDKESYNQFISNESFMKGSRALQSLFKAPSFKESSVMFWPYLVAIAALTFISGMIIAMKRKVSKNK